MTGRDQAYWNGRFEQLEKASHKTAEETMVELEREYRTASREVEREIAVWYQRFADNNGIVNMADARKLLDAGQLKEFRWTVDEYIRHGRENGVSADWRKELENASARFHISRLQALQVEMQNTVEVLFGNQTDALERMMKDTFLGQYYHTAFEVQRGLGFGWDIAGINGTALAKVIRTPWATDGRNFSERIWTNKTALINELRTQLSQNLLLGKGPDETIKAISAQFGVSENKTARLVYTESAYIQAVAQGDAYRELGVEHFRFIATLDDRTSDICRSMDGEVFSMKDYQPGATVPPLHPWCRSCTAPYYADLEGIGERAARDPDTGKTYFVPRDMKYKDWEQSFVKGGSKEGLTLKSEGRLLVKKIGEKIGESGKIIGGKELHGGTKDAIMSSTISDEDGMVMRSLGKISPSMFEKITTDITTDEVIITEERIAHSNLHLNAFDRYGQYAPLVLKDPDFVFRDKMPNTALLIREIQKEDVTLQLVLRLHVSQDRPEYKNSVLSFWNISEERRDNYERNKEIVYRRPQK